MLERQVDTGYGPGRVVVEPGLEAGRPPAFLLALTHGSGGDVDAPDLIAVRDVAIRLGGAVARITQPYRVRGARAPGSAVAQDAAWLEIVAALREMAGDQVPLLQGGRSNGARVACRTAGAAGALGVIALAFPLHPPGQPDRSRAAELRLGGVKLLMVSGARDPFGVPSRMRGARLVVLPGETHALSRNPAAVGAAVAKWLRYVMSLVPAATVRG
jgi:predicted alpha/beta-hydrolase family hydrolase